jgi:hypothetical protein
MLERYELIGLAFATILILADIMLLRKRKIEGKMFVFWFIIGIGVGFVSLAPFVLYFVMALFGAQFLLSSIIAAGFSFFLLLFFYLDYKISAIHSELMKLTVQFSATNYVKKQSEPIQARDSPEQSAH